MNYNIVVDSILCPDKTDGKAPPLNTVSDFRRETDNRIINKIDNKNTKESLLILWNFKFTSDL